MDGLPDDVLVHIMSHLELPELLHCRLVCRRIAPLALHPDVWRHRYFTYRDRELCTVLRLAPCLNAIKVKVPWPWCHLLFTAPCAVRCVSVTISGREGAAAQAALLLRHQKELGRLRKVRVLFRRAEEGPPLTKTDASVLFGTLVSTPDLDALSVGGVNCDLAAHAPVEASPPVLHRTVAASLKHFRCDLAPGLGLFCDAVLATHSATLVGVALMSARTPPTPSTAALLVAMPHLADLICPIFAGMDALAASASLRRLKLSGSPLADAAARAAAPAAARLLRRAHQLRAVHIGYSLNLPKDVELIAAMATSGLSHVESLSIENTTLSFPQLQELLGALPRLPALNRLTVYSAPDELQLDIRPVTAAGLRNFFNLTA
ncbi:uncharacterized protein LOC113217338 isoform X2 [Frankliniella occidentalis]|uniref:Uncharacterized protein LOC113217338 isoform X2 n=1 Tax=Frankliniella occidentalis TaxID=133901 RepID=A0A6J1THK6_FRAOC|nr:uncharacterized protein LOC113217338 isoform X2 [Frankliniella occidentalis]